MNIDKTKPVCVTGGSGFLGAHVVNELLKRGYNVRATVRDVNNEAKTKHIKALEGAKDRLTLVQANLLQEGSFDEAFQGCSVVIHTASPFFNANATEDGLTKPAIQGTLNVLNSMQRNSASQRLVLTSSTAAVYADFETRPKDHVYTEEDWSLEDLLVKEEKWYCLGKTKAEKLAYSFIKENKATFDLVTLNPTLILGPMLQPTLNESSKVILDLIKAGPDFELPNSSGTFVDVRNVAVAHVLAFENPSAAGRHLLISECAFRIKVADILRPLCPEHNPPSKVSKEEPAPSFIGPAQPAEVLFNCDKAKKLGIEFISLQDMLKETVASLRKFEFL